MIWPLSTARANVAQAAYSSQLSISLCALAVAVLAPQLTSAQGAFPGRPYVASTLPFLEQQGP